jgi:hypothetical protein
MDPNASIAASHIGGTLLVVSGIQWVKKLKAIPWVATGTKAVSRVLSILAAFCVQAGINYEWTANPNGTHNLLLTNVSLAVVGIGLFHVITQFLYQETGYQVLQGIQGVQGILNFLQSSAPGVRVAPTPEPVTASSAPAPVNPPIIPGK